MGLIKKGAKIVNSLGILSGNNLPDFALDKINKMIQEEQSDREAFATELEGFSVDDLRVFVPDVYQKNIYKINYRKLKEKGIRMISFDIDDTISDSIWNKIRGGLHVKVKMPDDAKKLFSELKNMEFKVVLLTNTSDRIAKDVCDELQAQGYIARANKPETTSFETLMDEYKVAPSEMAHVGNSMRQDIVGGNRAGVTTCLVRRAGYSLKVVNSVSKGLGIPTKGHLIREKLLEHGLWRKHHKEVKGDQYYQLGQLPKYQAKRTSVPSLQDDVARAVASDLIGRIEADKDKTYTLEELQRNIYKSNESAGMKTLRKHLGDEIVFTGVWAGARDERELEESELLDGELSGYVFKIGSYTIRSTACLYRDDDTVHYEEQVPAGQDAIAQYQQEGWRMLGPGSGVRGVQVISARHSRTDSEGWQHVCIAATSLNWDESIDFIGTLKPSASAADEQEVLFVLKQYTGDSFGVAHWYKLSANGTVTEHSEHPYDPESFEESWKD